MDLEGRNLSLEGVQMSGHSLPVYRFVQQYVSHLLPALERIDREENVEKSKWRREHVIRLEVDMALALSAKGFTWSHALRSRLEKERDLAVNILPFQNSQIERNMSFSLTPQSENTEGNVNMNNIGSAANNHSCCDQDISKENLGELVCDKPSWKNTKNCLSERKEINLGKFRNKRWRPIFFVKDQLVSLKMLRKIKAKKALESRIKTLRSITPGGNGMDTDVLFNELGSYISCLQVQVKVLHHLAESSGIMLPR